MSNGERPTTLRLVTLWPQKQDPNKFSGRLGDNVVLGRFRQVKSSKTNATYEVLDVYLMVAQKGNDHKPVPTQKSRVSRVQNPSPNVSSAPLPEDGPPWSDDDFPPIDSYGK